MIYKMFINVKIKYFSLLFLYFSKGTQRFCIKNAGLSKLFICLPQRMPSNNSNPSVTLVRPMFFIQCWTKYLIQLTKSS